ncbi:MAG: hypothetical protein GYA29_04405 [Methanothrix sp.]|nr:hypothetical protein [Methanothrix sp.]OPY45702.1 MAG: Dolichyl-monophosphooligosaccharide--protein glycosyltransferase AglB [Methanosaeta sp. PtaU1.Bin016]
MDRGRRSESAELLAIVFVGILLKLFAGRSSLTESGILLPGYDEYYHMRRILYTVNHFPGTLWFDSYLNYPYGFNITWPPLFDQISAALCLALGQQDHETIAAFVPVIIGSIAVAVVYYLVKELFGREVALLSAFMTILAPYYLLYTMLGAMDHHCLEVLMHLISLLFVVLAVTRSNKKYHFTVLAGIAMAALAYTWQGADVYLGIFLAYAAVKMTLDLKSGSSSKDVTTTLLAAYCIALILVLPFWNTPWMSPSFIGLAAMIFALSIMFALSRIVAGRNASWKAFLLGIVVLGLVFVILSQLTGGLFGVGGLIHSGLDYIWGGKMIGKIGEAEPLIYDSETFYQVVFSGLGLNLLFSLAALAAFVACIRRGVGAKKQGQILLFVWVVCTIVLTFGQSRFLYLSTISMGILISILFFFALGLIEGRMVEAGQRAPKWLAAGLLLILILPTLADTISFAENTPPAVDKDWHQALIWLKNNSDATSFYDNPDKNAEYSIMNWWDYGNWVLYISKRPVVANNFQAGVMDAAKFYLSEDEDDAIAVLDERGSRYILTDYKLIYSKLPAIAKWVNEDLNSYMRWEDQGSKIAVIPLQRLFNTTLARLYLFDAVGMGHFRLIYESATLLGESSAQGEVKVFEYVPGALIRVKASPGQRVGALLNMTSNQGRAFTYVNEASQNGDAFEMRVPYSTESRYETHAVGPYLIFAGNETGVNAQSLDVSESDVLGGNTIEIGFSRKLI